MQITEKEVLHLADLSKLKLSAEDVSRLQKELSGIVTLIAEIQHIKVDAGASFGRTIPLAELREDKAGESFSNAQVLLNAPDKADGGFLVPIVVE